MEVLTPQDDGWARAPLGGVPAFSSADVVSTDPDTSEEYLVGSSGFLEPATLRYGVVGDEPVTVKTAPSFFDAGGLHVRQHFATSEDGTRIPYFVVGPQDPSSGADPADRVRRVRGAPHAVVQRGHRPRLARAGRHLRRGQHPRRWRVRTAVAPGGAGSASG